MSVRELTACMSDHGTCKNLRNINQILMLTPLHLAIIQNNLPLVKEMLSLGANPNICELKYSDEIDIPFQTPISAAVELGSIEIVDELINAGADLNFCQYREDFEDPLPLVTAMKNDDDEMFKFLVERGADINNDNYDNYPLSEAVKMNNKKYVEIFVKMEAEFDAESLDSLVVEAVKLDYLGMVELLVDLGADINIRFNPMDNPLLIYAISNKNLDMVDFLLDNGADPNALYFDGYGYRTVLSCAIESGIETIIDKLLVYGLDVNKNSEKINSLELSLIHRNYDIAKRLLDNNANIDDMKDVKLPDIYTHLDRQYIMLFLDYPCDINVTDHQGKTLMDLALERNDRELVEVIKKLQK